MNLFCTYSCLDPFRAAPIGNYAPGEATPLSAHDVDLNVFWVRFANHRTQMYEHVYISTSQVDNYHIVDCWSHCNDDGASACTYCGAHNEAGTIGMEQEMYCCKRGWTYNQGHNCHNANFGTLSGHHCVTKALRLQIEGLRPTPCWLLSVIFVPKQA